MEIDKKDKKYIKINIQEAKEFLYLLERNMVLLIEDIERMHEEKWKDNLRAIKEKKESMITHLKHFIKTGEE